MSIPDKFASYANFRAAITPEIDAKIAATAHWTDLVSPMNRHLEHRVEKGGVKKRLPAGKKVKHNKSKYGR